MLGRGQPQSLFARMFDVTVINYLTLCMNLATGILTARVLGPSQKGIYYAVNSWVGMIGYVAGLGIAQAFVWYYNGHVDKRKIFKRTLLLGMSIITVSSGIGGVLVWFPLHRLGHVAVVWAAIGVAMLPVGTLFGLCTSYLMVRGRVRAYNQIRLLQGISVTFGIVTLACTNHLSLTSYFMCLYITSLSAIVVCAVVTFREFHRESPPTSSYIPSTRQFMKKSFAYFVPSLSSLFNARLDQMICTLWLTQRDIGLYGVSTASLDILGSVIGAFSIVFYPAMAQSDKDTITTKGNKAFRLYVMLSGVAVVCIISLSHGVLAILYGKQYVAAYPIVVGLAPTAVFSGLISILYQGFFSLGKPYYATITETVGAGSGAILIWILAPHFGAVGVSIANSLSYALDLGLCLYFWSKMGGKMGNLLPVWTDVKDIWIASKGRMKALLA